MSIAPESGKALLSLYRRVLRSCATYPSKNRWRIYESIREEFRENSGLDPDLPETREKIKLAHQGLGQLRMYDAASLGGGDSKSPNWSVTLEQNPMPKPPHMQ